MIQSAGAGVLADIKTLEAHGVYGYAAITGLTFQNERVIRRVDWLATEVICEQIDVCCESASFDWVKIGITPSMETAGAIIDHIHRRNPMSAGGDGPGDQGKYRKGILEAAGPG